MAPLLNATLLDDAVDDSNQILINKNAINNCIEYLNDTPVHITNEKIDALKVARQIAKVKNIQDKAFYVMNMDGVSEILNLWNKYMPRVQPYYVLRCNSDLMLLNLLTKNNNLGLSCINRQELEIGLKYVNKEQILYNNPFWTRANLRSARQQGIALVTITSEDDLYRFAQFYSEAKIILQLAIDRKLDSDTSIEFATSIDVNKGIELLHRAFELGMNVSGLSIWLRTRTPTAQLYNYALAQCRELFDIGCSLGHAMNVLNIGERISQSPIAFASFATALNTSLQQFFPPSAFKNLRIIAQPSALFAAPHYSLVTPIISKQTVSAAMLTTDENDECNIGYIYQINEGFFGAFGGCVEEALQKPLCRPLSMYDDKISTYAAFIGPTLKDADVVRSLLRIQQMQVGKWLLWDDMGAYSMNNCATMIDNDASLALHVHYFCSRKQWKEITNCSTPTVYTCKDSLFEQASKETVVYEHEHNFDDSINFDQSDQSPVTIADVDSSCNNMSILAIVAIHH